MGDFETLLYEEKHGVAYVTLNRPERLNAFNFQMQSELKHVWTSLRRNDDVRAIVLTGAGDRAFCTGIDRDEGIQGHQERLAAGTNRVGAVSSPFMFDDPGKNICPKTLDLWKPIIAAVNGMACGGALYMLGEVDIIIANEQATFFDPHVTYNMVCGFEAIHLLQKLPLGELLRMALLGAHERISAERAHDVGLISEIVPADELMLRAQWIAEAIASADPNVIQGTLQAIWTAHEHGRTQALALAHAFVNLGNTPEGLSAGQDIFASGKRVEWRLR